MRAEYQHIKDARLKKNALVHRITEILFPVKFFRDGEAQTLSLLK